VVEDSYCDVTTQPESERTCWPADCPQHIIPTSPAAPTVSTDPAGPAAEDSGAHWRTGTWGHVRTVLYTSAAMSLTLFTIHSKFNKFKTKKKISLCSQSTPDSAQIISAVLYKRAVAIRLGFVSAQRPASIIQFHVQERNLATEPSLWPGQSYGTVFLQQFVKQTLLARSSANSKLTFFLCALTMFDFDFCNALPVRARVGSGTITAIYYYYYYYYYYYERNSTQW